MKINETKNLDEVSRLKKKIHDLNTKIIRLENQNEVLLNTFAAVKIAIKRQEDDVTFRKMQENWKSETSFVQEADCDELSDEEIENLSF